MGEKEIDIGEQLTAFLDTENATEIMDIISLKPGMAKFFIESIERHIDYLISIKPETIGQADEIGDNYHSLNELEEIILEIVRLPNSDQKSPFNA